MFAVVQLPDFPLQALLRLQPALRGEPIAVLAGEGRRAVVAHVGAEAAARGITPGLTAAQALAVCPMLQFATPSLVGEREAGALLLAAGWSLSPRVELAAPGRCTIDLHGTEPAAWREQSGALRARLAAQGLTARVGFGANPLVARYAAQVADPELRVEDARSFLAPLPLALLPLTRDEERLFAALGLRTLGSLTAFPRAALASRLGARGDELWQQAAGEACGVIQPAAFPRRFLAEYEPEEPVATLEPLLFLLRRFTERLTAEVAQLGQGANRLSLTLRLEDERTHARAFELPEPSSSADVLFAVLENHLAALRTDAPITGLSLEFFPAHRLLQQTGLFDTGLTDAAAFFATLGRLAALVGPDNVGTPRHADTHRPDACLLTPPATSLPPRTAPAAPAPHGALLRRLRPPVAATVELTAARPSHLVSPLARGDVIVLRRPFWSNGDWAEPTAWAREEWDVRIGAGLYRLRHERRGWFIDGIYD